MKSERLRRLVAWFNELALSVSGNLRTPQPVLVPVRIEEAYERDLLERRKLLARTWPRLPPDRNGR